MKKRYVLVAASILAAASLFGFRRCGEGLERWFSTNPAPDVRGDWQVAYDDTISVEVEIGGETYDGTISGESGTVSFLLDGEPVTLDLDCSRTWVVCPSEIWATTVTLEQRQFQDRPHQVHMTVNSTDCAGATRLPDEGAGECDAGDPNRPCDVEICDNVVEETKTTIGSLSDPGETTQRHPDFDIELALGGDFAVPTPNCVLASWSVATANVLYTGDYDVDAPSPEMEAYEMTGGVITTGYAGACFWFEETAYTEEVKAALLAATVRLRTGFTAEKQ